MDWPDRYLARVGPELSAGDAVCVLTHDTKFDVPAIVATLATDVGYIGAMGSRRTKERHDARLREAGVSDGDLARVRAPIGLDLGARTPRETAVSICAEIIAAQTGTETVLPLSHSSGTIHRDGDVDGPGRRRAGSQRPAGSAARPTSCSPPSGAARSSPGRSSTPWPPGSTPPPW